MNTEYENLNAEELSGSEEYEKCTFVKCDLSSGDLGDMKFIDCTFQACNLSMSVLRNTMFMNVKFNDCKMLGLHFLNCNPFGLSMSFDHCILNYSSFHMVDLRNTNFNHTSLLEVDLAKANISGSVFDECDLQDALFDRTNCEKADFRYALNFRIDPENNRIAKAKFSTFGLAGLLCKYDIEIDE